MASIRGTKRSCNQSQRVFVGKPVQSHLNQYPKNINAIIPTNTIVMVTSQCFLLYCHHERSLAVIMSPLAKPKLCGEKSVTLLLLKLLVLPCAYAAGSGR